MPIDPRIPLGVQPLQLPSPLEVVQTISQIQGVRDQAEARRLAAEEAREKRNRAARYERAMQRAVTIGPDGQPTVDYAKLLPDVDAETLFEIEKTVTESTTRQAQLATANLTREQKTAEYVGGLGRAIAAAKYHPDAFGLAVTAGRRAGAFTQAQADQLLAEAAADPAAIQRYADAAIAAAGGETERGVVVGAGQQIIHPVTGALIAEGPPKQDTSSANVGSFEDYVTRWAAQNNRDVKTITTADIDKLRETYRLDPRITVNAGGTGQRPITQTAEAGLITRLNSQWTKASAPKRELAQQLATMRLGLGAAEQGNLAQGTEAVLQPFLKILDPNSVVREGEFWRLREGMSLLSRAQTAFQRLSQGGFVPLEELRKYASLAEEISKRYDTYVAGERSRIGRVADRYSIPQELVFEGAAPSDTPKPLTVTAPNGKVYTFKTAAEAAAFKKRAGIP